MPLVLRIDVDKPYGNHSFVRKIASKFFEETALPCPKLGYLDHLKDFLHILNSNKIPAIFYFRICSIPSNKLIEEIISHGHKIAWHLENSRSYETFLQELDTFKNKSGLNPHSFTKHGSGTKKLGRFHSPPYEAEKYIEWSKKIGIPFLFGNDLLNEKTLHRNNFYPASFWLEKDYRDFSFCDIDQVLKKAKNEIVPILTHPENVIRDKICREELLQIIRGSKENNIQWILL